ncbi:MAG: hypothetical protein J0L64_21360 [Acidobacteria bacterium]|nr:hypothetical protein [Acidobacteriota bacterium]
MRWTTAVLVVCLASPMWAQEPVKEPEMKYFKLDFVVKELDEARTVSSRTYSAMVATGRPSRGCSIRTGTRLPIQTSPAGNPNVQVQYYDIGVNIDCNTATEMGSQLSLVVTADVSSLPAGREANSTLPPVVRQNRWTGNVVVPIGKATTLFSSDDLDSKRKMQLELTVNPVK